jgi:hypothetical protein
MRKILSVLTLVVVFMMAITSVAGAKTGAGNPKGEVTDVDTENGTITLLLEDGSSLVITLPEDYDFETSPIEVGMFVVAKGEWTEDGFNADWVRETDDDPEDPGDDTGNAWGQGGVYCAGGKENVHPVAQKIADKYEVDPEWVMSYACDGHGFGGVMLALQTAEANEGGDAEEYLAQRKEGKGWGQIWKENGLVKNDKADNPPPGQLKKPDKDNGPDKTTPPGQENKPDKEKPPKTNNGKKPNKTPEDDSDGE